MVDNIKITHENTVRRPKEESSIPVSDADWLKLKKFAQRIVKPTNYYQLGYGFLFGVTASGVIGLIALYGGQFENIWVLPITWVITVGALLIGIALVFLDNRDKSLTVGSVNNLLEEMGDIEKKYETTKIS